MWFRDYVVKWDDVIYKLMVDEVERKWFVYDIECVKFVYLLKDQFLCIKVIVDEVKI